MISRREIYPDVGVALKETATNWDITRKAVAPTPIQLQTAVPTQIPHVVVEIFVKASGELVTAIEILSPANKRGKGYDEYLEKRNRLLKSTIHLIEIDWLRQGQRIPMINPLPDVPYFIFLSRVQTRPIIDVWPIQFNSKLPTIPIPLCQRTKIFYLIYRLYLRPFTTPWITALYLTTAIHRLSLSKVKQTSGHQPPPKTDCKLTTVH